jgi:hypothetical protein
LSLPNGFCDIIRFACFFGTLMKQIKQILKQILTDFFPVKNRASLERNPTIRSIRVLSFGTPMKPIKRILTDFFPVKKQSEFGTQPHNPFNPCSLFWNTDETDSLFWNTDETD